MTQTNQSTIDLTAAGTEFPGYVAGTWTVDTVHSDVSFAVRHMMVSKVRGRFSRFEGEIVTAVDPLASSFTATVDLSSIDTNNEDRDNHIRSADFFDTEQHPVMTYRSTGVRRRSEGFVIDGDLSLHGVTLPVQLELEVNGFGPDPYGGTRAGFTATGQVSRKDFGIDINIPMDGGGVVIGDKIAISIEVEAVLQAPSS